MAGFGAYIVSGSGVLNEVPPPVFAPRDPVTGVDNVAPEGWLYPPGQEWYNTITGVGWVISFLRVWTINAAIAGTVNSVATGSGTATPAAGVITIAGTANQIATAGAGSTVTLSLVGPFTPATFTAHGILIGEGSSSIVASAVGTNGQVLTGNTAADPTFNAIGTKSGLTAHGVVLAENAGAFVATAAGTTGQVLTATTGADPAFSAIGTGSGLTAHGVLLAEGSSAFAATAAGTTGQVLTAVTGADPVWSNSPASTVVDTTANTQAVTAGTTYISDAAAGLVVYTLPATAVIGARFSIVGNGPGGWQIAQNANQVIKLNANTTTVGVGGSVSSTNRYNSVVLVATVAGASTTWVIADTSGGALTFV